jgi:diadenosine tetraphosphatase ApaH/serine/threonine PP2A family protein phosphatase
LRHDGAVKLALLSDLHANVRAFDACLAHARAAGATQFALLGDLVGYGPEPVQLLERVMALAQGGAIVLRGNHDDAARQPRRGATPPKPSSSSLDACAAGPAHLDFLAHLPLTATAADTLLVHASAHEPQAGSTWTGRSMASRCLEPRRDMGAAPRVLRPRARAAACITAAPTASSLHSVRRRVCRCRVAAHRSWVALVGSVGQPRDGDPRAMYALLDAAQARLAFHRVAYDHVGAAAAVRAAALPGGFRRTTGAGTMTRLQEGA